MKEIIHRELGDIPEGMLWVLPLFESLRIDSPLERDLILARLGARIKGLKHRRKELEPNATLQYRHHFNWK